MHQHIQVSRPNFELESSLLLYYTQYDADAVVSIHPWFPRQRYGIPVTMGTQLFAQTV